MLRVLPPAAHLCWMAPGLDDPHTMVSASQVTPKLKGAENGGLAGLDMNAAAAAALCCCLLCCVWGEGCLPAASAVVCGRWIWCSAVYSAYLL